MSEAMPIDPAGAPTGDGAPAAAAVARRTARRDLRPVAGAAVAVILALAFVWLAQEVLAGNTARLDLAVITAMRTAGDLTDPLGPPWVEEMGRDVTALGSYSFLGFVLAATVGYLLLVRERGLALFTAATVLGGMAMSTVLKYAIDRPRPDFPHTARVFTPGFPSGHATVSTVTFVILAVLLTRASADRRVKAYIVAVAIFLTVMVGLSRMYLGVHYPSDVLAGWCAGGAWAMICWTAAASLRRRGPRGTAEPPSPEVGS